MTSCELQGTPGNFLALPTQVSLVILETPGISRYMASLGSLRYLWNFCEPKDLRDPRCSIFRDPGDTKDFRVSGTLTTLGSLRSQGHWASPGLQGSQGS